LERVLPLISAPQAWTKSRGKDVYIAIVDTGVCGTMAEFPDAKKAGGWSYDNSDPWKDYYGHGSMTACIAAATNGGKGSGVAPEARLYSCKTTFLTSELIAAYEWLISKRAEHGQPIIVNNSFAFQTCDLPQENGQAININHPFVTSIQQAIRAGLTIVFAAGNNQGFCTNPSECGPNSIWIWNSLDEVLSVGAVDQNNKLWSYSSRGPGQWTLGTSPKPDCVAPVFGEVMWNCGFQDQPQGWGTSGAAPQAAGLAALIASYKPNLSPKQILDCIRNTCDAHPSAPTCSGHGVLNCDRALCSL
jgi:subtilisin family serine protease